MSTHSKTDTYTQIFLKDELGNEYICSTQNWDIPMRVGNDLSVITLCKAGSGLGKVILTQNRSLKQVAWNYPYLKQELKKIYFPFLKWGVIGFFIIPFIITFISLVCLQSDPNSISATLSGILGQISMICGLISLLYGYHFCWRKAYYQSKKILNTYL